MVVVLLGFGEVGFGLLDVVEAGLCDGDGVGVGGSAGGVDDADGVAVGAGDDELVSAV